MRVLSVGIKDLSWGLISEAGAIKRENNTDFMDKKRREKLSPQYWQMLHYNTKYYQNIQLLRGVPGEGFQELQNSSFLHHPFSLNKDPALLRFQILIKIL